MSEVNVRKYMSELPVGTHPRIAVQLIREVGYFILLIPLWFNINWFYLIFSDEYIAICNKSLWKGRSSPEYVEYSELKAIIPYEEKKVLTVDKYSVWLLFNDDSVVELPSSRNAHKFISNNIERFKELFPYIELMSGKSSNPFEE